MLYEYFGNIHMHTTYSDGRGSFEDLVNAARTARLDFVYVTDHNVLVRDKEEGYRQGVLTLVGQEVNDEVRNPPGNHLLCLGINQDVTRFASDPQRLIDAVRAQGGLAFLAHPLEEYTTVFPDHYDWYDWTVNGYQGIELWNYLSRFRGYATNRLRAILVGYFPHWFNTGPLPAMLEKWDALCQERPVVAIGGTDVHAQTFRIGPFKRRFFSYLHSARALNTHVLTKRPMLGTKGAARYNLNDGPVHHDRTLVLEALAAGHCWVGYDLAGPTNGFRFVAWQGSPQDTKPRSGASQAILGDTLAPPASGEVTHFLVVTPTPGEIRLLHDGTVVARTHGTRLQYPAAEPGVYRVEVWKQRWGKPRGWIFANPIYVRETSGKRPGR